MMDSWDYQTPSPDIKFENSPAESFLSAPGEPYPSLFGSSAATTMDPNEMMTPPATTDDKQTELSSVLSGLVTNLPEATPSTPGSTATEKKPTKKRKSWGQVLPEPKTNLPPRYAYISTNTQTNLAYILTRWVIRKRAKTEDEKEQRRVERVLRNRRAAQSSRERKRLEVEALEIRNQELEALLRQAKQANDALIQKLHQVQSSGVMPRSSPPFEGLRANPVTFSQELFGSQDGHSVSLEQGDQSIEEILRSSQASSTVNPASLSPALSPIPDQDEEDEDAENQVEPAVTTGKATNASTSENASPDATQHPAEMLCEDLQCRSAEAPRSWLTASQQQLHPALALLLPLQLLLTSTSAMLSLCQRPLMQIAMSMTAGFSLPPTTQMLTTIIILVTTPRSRSRQRTSSTSTNSSTTTSTSSPTLSTSTSSSSSTPMTAQPWARRSSSLRLSTLRKILSCSPTLARPLMDATMAVLRLASTERHEVDRVQGGDLSAAAAANGSQQQQRNSDDGKEETTIWPSGVPTPSRETLLTLLWVLRVEERKIQIRDRISAMEKSMEPGRRSVSETTNQKFILKVRGPKRAATEIDYHHQHSFFKGRTSLKKRRFL